MCWLDRLLHVPQIQIDPDFLGVPLLPGDDRVADPASGLTRLQRTGDHSGLLQLLNVFFESGQKMMSDRSLFLLDWFDIWIHFYVYWIDLCPADPFKQTRKLICNFVHLPVYLSLGLSSRHHSGVGHCRFSHCRQLAYLFGFSGRIDSQDPQILTILQSQQGLFTTLHYVDYCSNRGSTHCPQYSLGSSNHLKPSLGSIWSEFDLASLVIQLRISLLHLVPVSLAQQSLAYA